MLLAHGGSAAGHPAEPRAAPYQGLIWGVLTGLCIAVYTVIDGWAIKGLGFSPALNYASGLFLRSLLLAPWATRDVTRL